MDVVLVLTKPRQYQNWLELSVRIKGTLADLLLPTKLLKHCRRTVFPSDCVQKKF